MYFLPPFYSSYIYFKISFSSSFQTVRALGKMRFNKSEVAALALGQPSHKFEKEGVLFVREKQEGFFRRSESKWEFFKGRIHPHLTDRPSVECVLYKPFFVFHQNLLKLCEVEVHMNYYNIIKLWWKIKKSFIYNTFNDGPSVKGRWIRP